MPGGSSGGSAAAVAARLAPVATGTDTGGSIRQPAALTGITGIKPTYGRVSRYGMIAFASSLDQAGVLAQSAEDAALVLGAMAGLDARDSTSVDAPVPDYVAGARQRSMKGLRIGVLKRVLRRGPRGRHWHRPCATALDGLRGHGREARRGQPAAPAALGADLLLVAPAEARPTCRASTACASAIAARTRSDLRDMYKRSRGEGFGAEVKRRIMTGTYVLSAGYYDAYYLKAQKVRSLINADFKRAFGEVDVLMGPTTPTPAFALGAKIDDPITMYLNDIYTIGANLAGLPAISIPCGFVDGLPVGLQLIGPHFAEERLLAAAHAYQQATDWHRAAAGRCSPEAARMSIEWETVIGLEIHAQLATRSKIFSGSSTAYGAAPNTQASLVDLGYPGVLPVLNREAVRMAVRFGLADRRHDRARARCSRARTTSIPTCRRATRSASTSCRSSQDGTRRRSCSTTARSKTHRHHARAPRGRRRQVAARGPRRSRPASTSTAPARRCSRSSPSRTCARRSEAIAYMKKIHTLVRYLEICDGNMQEGSFRCDANVSVRPKGRHEVRHALRDQESQLLPLRRAGHQLRGRAPDRAASRAAARSCRRRASTMPTSDETRPMRSKEEANDYRYFPDPDLLPLALDRGLHRGSCGATLPELPDQKAARFVREHGLSDYDAGVLTASRELADYYEAGRGGAQGASAKLAANWVMGDCPAS